MDLLVLGGTGFVSAVLVDAALELGHDVTCLHRGATGATPDGAVDVFADRDEPDAYVDVLDREWDAVIDTSSRPSRVRDAVATLGPLAAHWTYVSSVSIYADLSVPGDEDGSLWEPAGPDVDETDMEHYGALKAACEAAVRDAVGDRLLVVRPGLVVGPGDVTDRFGYWPARIAQGGYVLVPRAAHAPVQVIDVRDLAAWVVDAAGRGERGTYNLTGPERTLGEVLATVLAVCDSQATLVAAPEDWLLAHGVQHWMGPESLPLWLPPELYGMAQHSSVRAQALGLEFRPLEETVAASLEWEEQRRAHGPRRAGLTRVHENDLLSEVDAQA